MVELAAANLNRFGIKNVTVSVDSLLSFSRKKACHKSFDMIYCYFGALNTEPNLKAASNALHQLITPSGRLVLTFVNKWYLMEIPMNVITGRLSHAASRICNRWTGYSPTKELRSFPRSVKDIMDAIQGKFHIKFVKGYSIVHLPWYSYIGNRLARTKLDGFFWKIDDLLNLSPLKYFGEYCLYVMQPR